MRRTSLAITIFGLVMCVAASAGKIPLVASTLVPGASGKVSYEHDPSGNIKIHMQTQNLAAPEQLTPARNAYVFGSSPVTGSRRTQAC